MPRPPTDIAYVRRIEAMASAGKTAKGIFDDLKDEAEDEGRRDFPAERTVSRIVQAWKQKPEVERQRGAFFHWPNSMLVGALPWEASADVLELLRWHIENDKARPTNREALWYWRVKLACPTATTSFVRALATLYLGAEIARVDDPRAVELEESLAYAPWTSVEAQQRYMRAIEEGRVTQAINWPDPPDATPLSDVKWKAVTPKVKRRKQR